MNVHQTIVHIKPRLCWKQNIIPLQKRILLFYINNSRIYKHGIKRLSCNKSWKLFLRTQRKTKLAARYQSEWPRQCYNYKQQQSRGREI